MAIDLLDTPLRLTWDIPVDGTGLSGAELLILASRIAEDGVFYVTLEGAPLAHPDIHEIVGTLQDGGCQLLVACRGSSVELDALESLSGAVGRLLFDLAGFLDSETGLDSARLDTVVDRVGSLGIEPTLSVTPLRQNLALLPDLLRYCAGRKIAGFKLPNANIGDSFRRYSPADLPRWQDLENFRRIWASASLPDPLPKLEIHDLFLWEIMTPGQQKTRSEYGGCQAGNSLGHVDSAGMVHPCAAWPEPLGSLSEMTLDDIWLGPRRLSVRQQVEEMPTGCADCADWALCFGGCRGLALKLAQEDGGRDLMCRTPR